MSKYKKRKFDANGEIIRLVLQGRHGSADLVALYNMLTLMTYRNNKYSRQLKPVKEAHLKSFIIGVRVGGTARDSAHSHASGSTPLHYYLYFSISTLKRIKRKNKTNT
jgi:hypothetical protein